MHRKAQCNTVYPYISGPQLSGCSDYPAGKYCIPISAQHARAIDSLSSMADSSSFARKSAKRRREGM